MMFFNTQIMSQIKHKERDDGQNVFVLYMNNSAKLRLINDL